MELHVYLRRLVDPADSHINSRTSMECAYIQLLMFMMTQVSTLSQLNCDN